MDVVDLENLEPNAEGFLPDDSYLVGSECSPWLIRASWDRREGRTFDVFDLKRKRYSGLSEDLSEELCTCCWDIEMFQAGFQFLRDYEPAKSFWDHLLDA